MLLTKYLKNIGLKGRQIISLLDVPTYLGPVLGIRHSTGEHYALQHWIQNTKPERHPTTDTNTNKKQSHLQQF
jgi:hypothetical protein